MKAYSERVRGFTLVEILVAASISVLVLTGVSAGLVNAMRTWRAAAIRSDLHMNLEISKERIRHDLRLSSIGIGLMAFYPANASEYTAISFPLSTPNADGLLNRDAAGNIIWDTTVIYHVRPGSPDELIRSTFRPRSATATPAELYDQLVQVVQSSDLAAVQSAVLPGEQATSEVIFRNLVNLVFRPPVMRFDGYAPTHERVRSINWGSIVLNEGVHDLTFSVEAKNAASSGYKMGIDRFAMSYSGSPREGEMVLPANSRPVAPYFSASVSGGSIAAQDMSSHGASWSGRSQLTYTPDFVSSGTAGSRLTFHVQNDLWHDTNFDNPTGEITLNCRRRVDMSFTNQAPHIPDVVVAMEAGRSWEAENVTDGVSLSANVSQLETLNVIHGGTNVPSAVLLNGAYVRFLFRAGSTHGLQVRNATVGRRASGTTIVAGSQQALPFNNGSVHVQIPANAGAWTDWIPYNIDVDDSYIVRWERKLFNNDNVPPGQMTDAAIWQGDASHVLSYLDGVPDSRVVALTAMEVRAPSSAVYRSGVFDTRVPSPNYQNLSWSEVNHGANGFIGLRVRSSDYPDMHDATWYPSTHYLSSNVNNDISPISGGRYIQYEALFTVAGDHTQLPVLRDVTLTWEAPMGIVDLIVDLARGPDYGIITAEVNGQSFIRGVEVEIEIFRDGPYGTERVPGIIEVRPLNTGR